MNIYWYLEFSQKSTVYLKYRVRKSRFGRADTIFFVYFALISFCISVFERWMNWLLSQRKALIITIFLVFLCPLKEESSRVGDKKVMRYNKRLSIHIDHSNTTEVKVH